MPSAFPRDRCSRLSEGIPAFFSSKAGSKSGCFFVMAPSDEVVSVGEGVRRAKEGEKLAALGYADPWTKVRGKTKDNFYYF